MSCDYIASRRAGRKLITGYLQCRLECYLICYKYNRGDGRSDRASPVVPTRSPLNFICECSNLDCAEYIALSITQYEAFHERRDRFIVHEGHIASTVEKLTDQRDGYAIVEKFELNA